MGQVTLEDALEFHQGLVVESHHGDLVHGDARMAEGPSDGVDRETLVVLLSAERLLAGCSDRNTILQQAGGGIVIKATEAQDIHWVGV